MVATKEDETHTPSNPTTVLQQLHRRLRNAGCCSLASALWKNVKRCVCRHSLPLHLPSPFTTPTDQHINTNATSSFAPGRVPQPVEQRKYHERGNCISSFVLEPADLKMRSSTLDWRAVCAG